MANYYWLKLHFDMLDDYKVGSLPDSLKWRFIQCLLVAGELGEGGWLPPLNQFAFRIRPMTTEQLQADMSRLAAAELVELRIDDTGKERWFITNFQKRQKKISNKERQAAFRERQRQAEYNDENTESLQDSNDDVTNRYADKIRVDKDIEAAAARGTNDDEEITNGIYAAVYQFYESNIGSYSPMLAQFIGDAIDEHGPDDVVDAMKEAVRNNVLRWSYVDAILERWGREGRGKKQKVSKQDNARKLINLVGKFGKFRYKDALPEIEQAGLLGAIKSMGGWSNVCMMNESQIPFEYYKVMQ